MVRIGSFSRIVVYTAEISLSRLMGVKLIERFCITGKDNPISTGDSAYGGLVLRAKLQKSDSLRLHRGARFVEAV